MLRRMRLRPLRGLWWLALGVALVATACSSGAPVPGTPQQQSITLYTCVNDTTIQPVISAFQSAHPGSEVKLFRAPTGELNARVAGDVRSGGLKADVVWACDPLTMRGYGDQQLVGGWLPDEADSVPKQFRTADAVGAAVLYLVAVSANGVAPPKAWSDMTGAAYAPVAVPDPAVAASALGALGYFSQADGYGLDFYRKLQQQGAKQVSTPDNVTTGVAQGQYRAGLTIANSAYLAQSKGSPIEVTWPKPGAVAIYGPIALARHSADSALAKDFISYVVSQNGQQVAADAGSYPTRPGVSGPKIPSGAPVVYPDWEQIAGTKDKLLKDYSPIFGD
jgi:iron(III) transport system substrate-binding protein